MTVEGEKGSTEGVEWIMLGTAREEQDCVLQSGPWWERSAVKVLPITQLLTTRFSDGPTGGR